MRIKLLGLGLFLSMLLLSESTVCGQAEAGSSTDAYSAVLQGFCDYLPDVHARESERPGSIGAAEAVGGKKGRAALASVGYALQDISGDGVPELLIAPIQEKQGSAYYGRNISAVYACSQGETRCVVEGWARNRYYLLNGGKLFREGSGGARYSIFGSYTLSQDASSLTCDDLYFTYEKGNGSQEIGFYHNKSGVYDKAASEEMNISLEGFEAIRNSLHSGVRSLELISFSEYQPAAAQSGAAVSVQLFDVSLGSSADYDVFTVPGTDAQSKVVFTSKEMVRNFKILALEFQKIDEAGKPVFLTKEIYTRESLSAERPLLVGLAFMGTIPHYGIAYVDAAGNVRRFAVELSGRDGSAFLSEF